MLKKNKYIMFSQSYGIVQNAKIYQKGVKKIQIGSLQTFSGKKFTKGTLRYYIDPTQMEG